MAPEAEEQDPGDGSEDDAHNRTGNGTFNSESEEEEDGEDEEEEPRLGYASLTKSLGPVYRNGDATSAFLVAGDKMVGSIVTYADPSVRVPSEECLLNVYRSLALIMEML